MKKKNEVDLNIEVEDEYTQITCLSEVERRIRGQFYENKMQYPMNKKLNEDYIFDEDKSVKWNREEVVKHNLVVGKLIKEYNNHSNELKNLFFEDCITALKSDLISEDKAKILYNYAYNVSHSGGYYEVVNTLNDLEELAIKLLS